MRSPYPPTQKAKPACRNACLPTGRHFGVQVRSLRLWVNAERVPFEAQKERRRGCFGGFRSLKHVEGLRGLARGAPLLTPHTVPS